MNRSSMLHISCKPLVQSFIFFDYYISPEPDTDILHHMMLHPVISFWIFKQASDLLCSSFVIPHFDYMTDFTIPDNSRNATGRSAYADGTAVHRFKKRQAEAFLLTEKQEDIAHQIE